MWNLEKNNLKDFLYTQSNNKLVLRDSKPLYTTIVN